jgi:hypothetical protein
MAGLGVLALAGVLTSPSGWGGPFPAAATRCWLRARSREPRRCWPISRSGWAAIAVAAARDLSGGWEWAVRAGAGFVGSAVAAAPPLLAGGLYLFSPNVAGPPGFVGYSSHGVIAFGVLSVIAVLAIVVSIFVLWQAISGIRAGRIGAVRLSRSVEGRPLLWIGAISAVKVAWLGLGYAGLLPTFLGGASSSWEDSRLDGLLSWVIAVCFAIAALLALARLPLQRIDERGLRPVVVGLAAAFTGFFALGGLALVLYAALGSFSDQGALRASLEDTTEWLRNGILWSTVIAVFAAAVLAALLLLARRSWIGLTFLVVFVVWALRALQATPGLSDEQSFQSPGVNVVTFDAVLAVALAVLLAAWHWGKQRSLPPAELALILGVSTLVADTGTLLGGWDSEVYFYLALVFPAAYLFLFDARALNREGPHRRRRVLGAIGAASVLLSLVAIQILLGQIGPGEVSNGEIVQVVMAVPIAGVLVAASLAALRGASTPTAEFASIGSPEKGGGPNFESHA